MTLCFGRSDVSLDAAAGIDLYWLPLGAGGHSVRLNGKVYEAAAALLGDYSRRPGLHEPVHIARHVRGIGIQVSRSDEGNAEVRA